MTAADLLRAAGHIHITEREADGTWEDCTFCSGLEWYRLVYDARKPATHAEAEALRRVSGRAMTGGTNYGDFVKAVKTRYGVTITAVQYGFAALQKALTPGKVAAISGSMKVFGPTHRLSKWDPGFDDGHAVALANIGGTLLWCDPEAPTGADVPVEVTWGEVKLFVTAFNGGFLVGSIRNLPQPQLPKEDTVELTKYLPGYTATIIKDSNVRVQPVIASTKVRATTADETGSVVIGTVLGDADPKTPTNKTWYAFWKNGKTEYTHSNNVTALKAPAPTDDGYTKATQDAAVAAAVAPLNAKVALLQPLADRLAAIKAALGL